MARLRSRYIMDAFAILLAAHHPSLRLLGISTVHGNASLSQTTKNALSVLTAIGRTDITVHPGAAKPFCRDAVHAPDIHGQTGLDGTELLPSPTIQAVTRPNAVLAMRHALLAEEKGSAWLVATGTLTNVALLFAAFPEVVGHIKGLSIMGGAIGDGFTDAPMGFVEGQGERVGNHTEWAEFNIYCDPEAAKAIFSNAELAAKTTLIPLDLSHQVFATKDIQQRILHGSAIPPSTSEDPSTKLRLLFHDLLVFFAQTYKDTFGLTEGPPLHDPIAVAVLLDDLPSEALAFDDRGGERWHVTVVTDGSHSDRRSSEGVQVGRTIATAVAAASSSSSPSSTSLSLSSSGVCIPRSLNVQSFWSLIDRTLADAVSHLHLL